MIEGGSQRVKVGVRPKASLTAPLLRRRVLRGKHSSMKHGAPRLKSSSAAKIYQHRAPTHTLVSGQEDVVRFEVAVQQSGAVNLGQRG